MTHRAKTKRVAVLMGGWSAERAVSLTSGRGVAAALLEKGYDAYAVDVTKDLGVLLALLSNPAPDVVFNALHGVGGEDGVIQGVLDMLELPYTHSGLLASALAMDKPTAKRIFAAAGLRCPEGVVVRGADLMAGDPLPRPYVAKPPADGSSVGVHVVRPGDPAPAVDPDAPFLVERFIPGREMTVAVRTLADGSAQAMGAIDIRPRSGWFDYDAKYSDGGAIHVIPPHMHPDAYAQMLAMAEQAHAALGCRGVSRSDFRYDDTGGEPGIVYLLELNTQPGMTPLSLVPDVARSIGLSYGDLVAEMVEAARWG